MSDRELSPEYLEYFFARVLPIDGVRTISVDGTWPVEYDGLVYTIRNPESGVKMYRTARVELLSRYLIRISEQRRKEQHEDA